MAVQQTNWYGALQFTQKRKLVGQVQNGSKSIFEKRVASKERDVVRCGEN